MKGTEHQDAALALGGNREAGSLKGFEREGTGDSATSRRQQSSPKSSTMHLLCSVHADDGDGKPSGTTTSDGTYDSSQLGKRKLDEADVVGLVREASSGCGVVVRGASSAKNNTDTDHHLSSEEDEAEEAGLSLLFAASLMQQNDDAANDGDGDDVAPIDTTTMTLFDPVGTRHLHAAAATPVTATATIPAFPQLTTGASTSAVASLPASAATTTTTLKPSTRPASSKQSAFLPPPSGACSSSGTISEPTENDGTFCGSTSEPKDIETHSFSQQPHSKTLLILLIIANSSLWKGWRHQQTLWEHHLSPGR